MKIALVIGHNNRSEGAYSETLGMTEYDYYKEVAAKVKEELKDVVDIYERQPNKSYTREMTPVIEKINSNKYDYILELHFNAATNKETQGCECLVHFKSTQGINIANNFLNKITNKFRNLRNRGLIKIENSSQRGGYGICKTKYPYILVEPFFGSNEFANQFTTDIMANLLVDFIRG